MDNECADLKRITGRYSYIGNPCLTDPCLPGMVYAVFSDGKYYYITVNGHLFPDNRSWDDYTPRLDDMVTIAGYVQEKKDVFEKPYHTIETTSLKRAE